MISPSYWSFIESHYPNYYSCEKILWSDILFRKLEGESISEEDEKRIQGWDVKKEFLALENQLFSIALQHYLEKMESKT